MASESNLSTGMSALPTGYGAPRPLGVSHRLPSDGWLVVDRARAGRDAFAAQARTPNVLPPAVTDYYEERPIRPALYRDIVPAGTTASVLGAHVQANLIMLSGHTQNATSVGHLAIGQDDGRFYFIKRVPRSTQHHHRAQRSQSDPVATSCRGQALHQMALKQMFAGSMRLYEHASNATSHLFIYSAMTPYTQALHKRIPTSGRVAVSVYVMHELAETLVQLHSNHFVHGNICAQSLLFDADRQVIALSNMGSIALSDAPSYVGRAFFSDRSRVQRMQQASGACADDMWDLGLLICSLMAPDRPMPLGNTHATKATQTSYFAWRQRMVVQMQPGTIAANLRADESGNRFSVYFKHLLGLHAALTVLVLEAVLAPVQAPRASAAGLLHVIRKSAHFAYTPAKRATMAAWRDLAGVAHDAPLRQSLANLRDRMVHAQNALPLDVD